MEGTSHDNDLIQESVRNEESQSNVEKRCSSFTGSDALPVLANPWEDGHPWDKNSKDNFVIGEKLDEFEALEDSDSSAGSGLNTVRDIEATQHDPGAKRVQKSSATRRVPFYKLYSFADRLDYFLMGMGSIGACTHGVAVPIFFVFFGKLIDAFGANYNNPIKMGHEVSKYSLYLFYLGLVVMGASWLEVACWMQTGERQSAHMRTKYLKAVLSQDMSFFDTQGTTDEIGSRISSETALVQDAISEKAGNFLHFMAKFLAGFAVGFSSVWQLSLITLAVVPAIVVAGLIYAMTMTGHAGKSQKAYEEAGKVAEQVISQVRTVYSFVGEERAVREYSAALQTTLKLGKRGGLTKGLGLGFTYGLCVGAWALLLWYSGVLVRHGSTNGGKAFTTILNVVVGGM